MRPAKYVVHGEVAAVRAVQVLAGGQAAGHRLQVGRVHGVVGGAASGPVSEMAGASSCLNSVVLTPLDDLRVTHYSHVVPDCFSTELGVNTTGSAIGWAVRTLRIRGVR
jgi:hypothetical protein